VQTKLPPTRGKPYLTLVPAPDVDGNDTGGVRPMETRVPLGTNLGWNLRAERAPDLCGLSGAYLPFAASEAARVSTEDPRLSLAARYGDHDGFVRAVRDASAQLVRDGFMLEEDARRYVDGAEQGSVLRQAASFRDQYSLSSIP
jgi:hypothetical protein